MKKHLLALALLAATSSAFVACDSKENTETTEETAGLPDGTVNVDLAASEVMWEGNMVGMYKHSGDVKLTDGNVVVADGRITGGSFTVDLGTINPTDENFDAAKDRTPEKLVGHLSSDDFFAVEQHPKATFEITGSAGDVVMGNLTVRGKTNPEEVKNVVVSEVGGKLTMSGDMTFDRTKYDVSFKHPMQDMVVSNDVAMKVKLVANK